MCVTTYQEQWIGPYQDRIRIEKFNMGIKKRRIWEFNADFGSAENVAKNACEKSYK
jgi:hypothetical protein